ncbi:hypothetical protein sync_2278 [Synechococcus sp. CC9311]|nr:hypothetical protein sync_2278 [Synechococcus sp. CC9311]
MLPLCFLVGRLFDFKGIVNGEGELPQWNSN